MVKVISEPNVYKTIISLEKGSVFYSRGIVPNDTEDLVKIGKIASGETRIVAKRDLVAVVEGLWQKYTGANHVVFIRAARTNEGVGSLWYARISRNPVLRQALIAARAPYVESVGGFEHAVLYSDEIVVLATDCGMEGCYGWIIRRNEAEKYLEQNKSRTKRITIWHETHLDHNGNRYPVVRIEGWSPPQKHDDITVWDVSEYIVVFNEETRIVQKISLTNAFVSGLSCDRAPLKSVAIGKRLPPSLAWR